MNNSMRIAMYYSNDDIRLEKLPKPQIGKNEALMRVMASGICGTDVMEWYRIHKVPLVLGHEVSGILDEVGGAVKNFKVGDRVIATHHVPCGRCEFCLNGHATVCDTLHSTNFYPGGFSEFVRLPEINLRQGTLKLPRNVSFEEATFVEPLGCAIRGQRLAGMKKGRRVLIIGSGISGLLHVKLARYWGAKTIVAVDIDAFRLQMAKEFGATVALNAPQDLPAEIRKINGGRLADLVILCAGAQEAVAQGLRSVERGGVVLIFTAAGKDTFLPVPTNDIFWRSEATLLSSYAASPQELKEALKLIVQRRIIVRDMITHRLKLEDIQQGFQLVIKPRNSIKVIIEPHPQARKAE